VVRKSSPASFSFILSCSYRRLSSATRRPPPWTGCSGHHPKHPLMPSFRFAITLATCRCNPHAISWPGAIFRPAPATPPLCAAARAHACTARLGGRPRSTRPRVKLTAYRSTQASLLKSPSAFYVLQAGPSTIEDHYNQILVFMF
jgi:hypothetical protein